MSANKKDFEKFYDTHFDKVYRFVFFRTGQNKDVAEDLVSEIFIKVLKHFNEYDETISKSAWLMTITKNHLANFYRDSKPTETLPDGDDAPEGRGDAVWLKYALAAGQKMAASREAAELLLKLDEDSREIVTFHYLFGYNYKEIAEIKQMTEGAAKVVAHRAIKKLRKLRN